MMIVWNERSLRWFRNASEYTGYNKKLARLLLEHIPSRNSLCDIGCGIGLVDLELAEHIAEITCLDISQTAIDAVEQLSHEQGLTNVNTCCMDAAKAVGQWETVIALLQGGEEVVLAYLQLAKDQLILGVHGSLKGVLGPEGRRGTKYFDTNSVRTYLEEQGIKYHLLETEMEYGQPLTDLQDAQEFISAYTLPMNERERNAYLEKHLERTGDERFPYYLPKKRAMGIFVIRKAENPQL